LIRHLAQVWENTFNAKSVSFIESIDMLILLDLLGTSDMILRPLQISTESTFLRIVEIERKMNQLGLLPTVNQQEKSYFIPYQLGELRHGGIEDDHLPFLERNVPVLHLISVPFPKVWHTFEVCECSDNEDRIIDVFLFRIMLMH
jgi:glutaminyl-peptide cyclotransferase